MEVVVSKRKISAVQYVDDARKIADQIIERMEKFIDKINKHKKIIIVYSSNQLIGNFFFVLANALYIYNIYEYIGLATFNLNVV